MPLTAEDLSHLTLPGIFAIAKSSIEIPSHQRKRGEVLVRYILEHADPGLKGKFAEAVNACATDQHLKRNTPIQISKPARSDVPEISDGSTTILLNSSRFLQTPL